MARWGFLVTDASSNSAAKGFGPSNVSEAVDDATGRPIPNRVRLIITRALLTAPGGLTWDEYGEIAADALAADGRAIPNRVWNCDRCDVSVSGQDTCPQCGYPRPAAATRNRVHDLRDALRLAAKIPDRQWAVWEATGRPETMRPREGEAVLTLDEALAIVDEWEAT